MGCSREQLVRLTREVIPNWLIIEADSYDTAIEKIDTNQINILISDLYLEPNEDINYNFSGIALSKYFRNKQPDGFIYIVSSNLTSLISKNQLVEYIDIGISDFLDRNVNPYEKFIQKFHYTLEVVNNAVVSGHSELAQNQDIRTNQSYWILISDLSDQKYQDLVQKCMFWSISPRKNNVFLDVRDVYEISSTHYTNLNFEVNDSYPVLFIGDSFDFADAIKLSSQIFDLNEKHLSQLLNSFNLRILQNHSILDIKKEMQNAQYWKWLDNHHEIKGFLHQQGILLFDKNKLKTNITANKIERIVIVEKGNYNESISGDYIEKPEESDRN